MTKWRHTLPNGTRIRELITSAEDNEALLTELKIALLWIADVCSIDEDYFPELDAVNEAIELEAFDEDEVNARLADLYDVCDDHKVWVAI